MHGHRSFLKVLSAVALFWFQMSSGALAQTKPEDLGLTAMQVKGKTGVINFYVSADPSKDPPRKPLFVFLQGSQARPILQVQRAAGGSSVTKSVLLFVFDLAPITQQYHYVALGKHGLPFIADDSFKTPPEYYGWSSLENRTSDVNDVIEYLLRQPWVDPSRVFVVGHSQGADVAAKVAAANPHVTHVACLSGGGLTQMWDFVFNQRKKMLRGEQSFEQAQANIEDLYKQYREVHEDPSTKRVWEGESYLHWSSFFAPIVDSLVKVDIPVYVVIGSEDTAVPVESTDIIPLEFIRLGKTNLTYRVLPGVGHSLGGKDGQHQLIYDLLTWAECKRSSK